LAISARRLGLLAAAVFLVGIVCLFPARVAYHLFAPEQIKLRGLSGTVWSGSASEGEVNGIYLSDLRWSLTPGTLLRGALGVQLAVNPAGGYLDTHVAVRPGGTLVFSELQGGIAISALQAFAAAPGIAGDLQLALSSLRLEDGFPTEVDGLVDVRGFTARGLSTTPIGDFRVELGNDDEGIVGSLEDTRAMLDVAGSLRLANDRSYLMTGLVAATDETSAAITNQLQYLGPANERGQREFRFEGRL